MLRASSATASLVVEGVTVVPFTSSRTCAVVAPFLTSVILPLSRFLALIFTMASLWFEVLYSTASPQSLCIKVYNDLAPYCSSKGRGVNGTAGVPEAPPRSRRPHLAACPRNPVLTPSLYSIGYIDLEPG